MNPYYEDEITGKEFFEILQSRLMYKDPKTGERKHFYTHDKDIISPLKAFWTPEELDEKVSEKNLVFNVLFTLHYLRRAINDIIKYDLRSKVYIAECQRDFKGLDSEFYEKLK